MYTFCLKVVMYILVYFLSLAGKLQRWVGGGKYGIEMTLDGYCYIAKYLLSLQLLLLY